MKIYDAFLLKNVFVGDGYWWSQWSSEDLNRSMWCFHRVVVICNVDVSGFGDL